MISELWRAHSLKMRQGIFPISRWKYSLPPSGIQTSGKRGRYRRYFKADKDFWKDITGREALSDKTVLISSHGCAVRALLQNVYCDKENFWHGKVPPNCSVNIVEVKDGKAKFLQEDKVY